ncbi:MAG: radical SAM family heme chaperone HemW [Desulfobacula sp.]|uniref:radical SAM family heme chaperone HemW n=1 Tax=Desulfobacula sp. TaxID=2593537 RepID=UPI001D9CF550|nr:radical SAM family heme chaperone HemW [Desulfobacula sp.]MBT3484474.1 radical SAM family heme chaperone HemW [Desulfobacula sp.]MBT3803112.1 radical SAM family heme chaperone HemW [Desulfobacula sp.]MBT4024682.1 radical SAM family heme chaperone HemW [Desulfobacula sp.]MBT4197160.1 radical SAM family heme chaperone HemW [Desulfobacula sp.]
MCDQKSIYIHIPFCVKKCNYCDFFSNTNLSLIPTYINALQKEIKKRSGSEQKINTIYFGGGTPSLLSIKDIKRLFKTIADNFRISPDAEITFEVNPGTINFNYLRELKNTGINRLSIGTQSFNDDKLKFLNRIHTAKQAVKAINDTAKAGFDNISIDFIYGLPFETQTIWKKDLKQAIGMTPSHLSCYMLTIEHGTPLYKKFKKSLITPLGSEDMSALFKKTANFLNNNKYEHYEISSFANGRANRSRHNSKYWSMKHYYGFGAAAHSYDGKTRSWNHRDIDAYIKDLDSGGLPVEERETLTSNQKMMEMIMLRLRTLEGLDLAKFQTLFLDSFEKKYKEILEQIFAESLGFIKDQMFALTLEGKTRLNSIVEAFARKTL